MSFDKFQHSRLRPFLFPFSLATGLYIRMRNWMYDRGIIKSAAFNFPLICVGNLSVGGTGKSPMVEYIVRLLQEAKQVAVLSRGYKRKTKGYLLATTATTALEIGDEPMQFHQKFPNITVAVCEERAAGIPMLLHDKPDTDVIILDDAFQHRHVSAGLNIVLMQYDAPFWEDSYLPAGNLRDVPGSLKRAQIVVITKCPDTIVAGDTNMYLSNIKKHTAAEVFFAKFTYGLPYHMLAQHSTIKPDADTAVLLITGIANPKPLQQIFKQNAAHYEEMIFDDHHIFTIDDLRRMKKTFDAIPFTQKIMLTTEKDAVRMEKFGDELTGLPFYVVPVSHSILFKQEAAFNHIIQHYVHSFYPVTTLS